MEKMGLRWRVEAKSEKGKSKLRQTLALTLPSWDGIWETIETRMEVPFAPGVAGPWHFVRPEHVLFQYAETLSLWVHEYWDKNFRLTAVGAIDEQI